jgi:hypothetical protein
MKLLGTISVDFDVTDQLPRRMMSSGMLRRVALVRTDVSEEPSASFTWYFFAALVGC